VKVQRGIDPVLVDQVIQKKESMLKKVRALFEVNPMLGHRGVRLGLTSPRDLFHADPRHPGGGRRVPARRHGGAPGNHGAPGLHRRGAEARSSILVDAIHQAVETHYGVKLDFKFGTMMEVVRACMRAESLAEEAEFFSFGTNDLTQATFSFSREDAENKFLPMYNQNKILQDNPFEVLDVKGVGRLMEAGRGLGPRHPAGHEGGHLRRARRPSRLHPLLPQGGPDLCVLLRPRVPVARLAAAHAALNAR
jgi:pyruvate,orthophosphate dikinase